MKFDYFADEINPPANTLEKLRDFSKKIHDLSYEILEMEGKLAKKKEEYKLLTQETVPEIMAELQMKSFKMIDGSELVIENKVVASILAEKKEDAFNWLEENGYGGIIKSKIDLQFSRNEVEKAKEVIKILEENDIHTHLNRNVHPVTLNAFVKEILSYSKENGKKNFQIANNDGFEDDVEEVKEIKDFPHDIFNIYEFKQCKLKSAKNKR